MFARSFCYTCPRWLNLGPAPNRLQYTPTRNKALRAAHLFCQKHVFIRAVAQVSTWELKVAGEDRIYLGHFFVFNKFSRTLNSMIRAIRS